MVSYPLLPDIRVPILDSAGKSEGEPGKEGVCSTSGSADHSSTACHRWYNYSLIPFSPQWSNSAAFFHHAPPIRLPSRRAIYFYPLDRVLIAPRSRIKNIIIRSNLLQQPILLYVTLGGDFFPKNLVASKNLELHFLFFCINMFFYKMPRPHSLEDAIPCHHHAERKKKKKRYRSELSTSANKLTKRLTCGPHNCREL